MDLPRRRVDLRAGAEQDLHARVGPQDAADRLGDHRRGQGRRRHLIEKRLEPVVVVPVDHGDGEARLPQCLGHLKPAEARADHQHPTPIAAAMRNLLRFAC
jgi:hypothetical protein